MLSGIGVILEGLPLMLGFQIIGVIRFIGAITLAFIALYVSKRLQLKFNIQMGTIEQQIQMEESTRINNNT